MKKWFFMLICMVAFVLPQNVWAQTSSVNFDSGTKMLTVNSDAAGWLSSQTILDEWKTCTSIIFVGKFNETDLQKLQQSAGFTSVTTVDMSEARFVIVNGGNVETPSSYVMFASEVPTTSTSPSGTHAILGGQLWHSVYTGGSWVSTSAPANESDGNGARVLTQDQVNQNQNTEGLSKDAYGKVSTGDKYLQLTAENQSWGNPSQTDPGNATPLSANTEGITEWETYLNSILPNYSNGQSIEVTYYFEWVEENGGHWGRSTSTVFNSAENNLRYYNPGGANFTALFNGTDQTAGGAGKVLQVIAYYTKTDSGRAWANEQTTVPEGYNNDEASFDYAYRGNHLNDYAVGTWVKMTDYSYYMLNSTGYYVWAQINPYENGGTVWTSTRYSTSDDLPNNPAANQYAIVGGTEYISNGSTWSELAQSDGIADYSQMKFSYWSGSITTAITSKYADSNISSDIFNSCTSITRVDFLGGHVKGLSGKTPALTTLFIGKDVTEIEAAQVQEITSLKTLTFDKDYSSYATEEAAKAAGYPKQLVISNKAFYGCRYLESVEIPNRCVSIGNSAFERVGNQGDTDINTTPKSEKQTFTLAFERRNKKDEEGEKKVGISCDFPLTIGESAFMDCWYLRDLSLPIRLYTMGKDCFKNTIGMKTLEMREETKAPYVIPEGRDLLRTIPEGAFYDSAVEEIKIPKCVTEIQKGAFGDTEHLKKLVFQDNDDKRSLTIKAGAFTGGQEQGRPQLDVYVMINPEDGRRVICEYEAFNFTQTVGQTSVNNPNPSFAYLHFPEEAWDYYQGDWKRGLAFRQDNLNAMKDGFNGTNNGKVCHGKSSGTISDTGIYEDNDGDVNTQYAPANGWQEFARSNTSIDIIIPAGSFVRTYSTKEPQVIPTFALVANKPSGVQDTDPLFKIYRISKFEDNYTGGESVTPSIRPVATATEITEEYGGRKYIPPYTGVIMVGTQTDVAVLVYLSDIEFVSPAEPYTYGYTSQPKTVTRGDDGNYDITNFLFPACADDVNTTRETTADGVERVILNPTYPYPYHGAQPDYRFFALAKNSSNQYYFSRFKKGGFATRDKAYLKLSKDVFHWSAEGETASGTGSATGLPEPGSTQAPIMMSFMNPEGNTTDVRMINLETMTIMDDCYYTLQGVKISGRPTQQGIYIHNGKKVVIK